jgi:hypothetical protein
MITLPTNFYLTSSRTYKAIIERKSASNIQASKPPNQSNQIR